jgi:hypothetical protein
MSTGLRNMNTIEKKEAIARRIKEETKGLGYWGAIDAEHAIATKEKKQQKRQ